MHQRTPRKPPQVTGRRRPLTPPRRSHAVTSAGVSRPPADVEDGWHVGTHRR